jgi:hypothetical protein
MATRSSLLVDLGATYVKVAVLRPDEGIVAESNFPFPDSRRSTGCIAWSNPLKS